MWLARRSTVRGGRLSYSLYLVHIPMFELFWTAQQHFPAELGRSTTTGHAVGLAVLLATVPVAALVHRLVEEPARLRLGRLGRFGPRPAPRAPERPHRVHPGPRRPVPGDVAVGGAPAAAGRGVRPPRGQGQPDRGRDRVRPARAVGAGQPAIASSSFNASGGSARPAPATFSRRWSTDDVPGISRMFGERCRSHASATDIGVAPSRV